MKTLMFASLIEALLNSLGEKQTLETGAGWSESKRGSRSRGDQRVMRPSARPIASMAWPPWAEEKDREVICPANGEVKLSGVFTPRVSDQR